MKIIFTLEEVDDEVGISVDCPLDIPEDSKIMAIAAHMFGSVKLKDEPHNGSNMLQ